MGKKGIFFDTSYDLKRKFKSKLGEKDHSQKEVLEAAILDYILKDGEPRWFVDKEDGENE